MGGVDIAAYSALEQMIFAHFSQVEGQHAYTTTALQLLSVAKSEAQGSSLLRVLAEETVPGERLAEDDKKSRLEQTMKDAVSSEFKLRVDGGAFILDSDQL